MSRSKRARANARQRRDSVSPAPRPRAAAQVAPELSRLAPVRRRARIAKLGIGVGGCRGRRRVDGSRARRATPAIRSSAVETLSIPQPLYEVVRTQPPPGRASWRRRLRRPTLRPHVLSGEPDARVSLDGLRGGRRRRLGVGAGGDRAAVRRAGPDLQPVQPGSELNRVNDRGRRADTRVAGVRGDARVALEARRESGGLVDPTFGPSSRLPATTGTSPCSRTSPATPAGVPTCGGAGARLDGTSVLVPAGMRLDLNGVVKGRTVDDALALIDGEGFVSAGGDLATRGAIVVALPRGGTVRLVRGALATSGTRPPSLGPRRTTAAPSDRSADRAARPSPRGSRSRVCGSTVRRRGRRRQGRLPARPRRASVARRARPARAVRRRGGGVTRQPLLAAKRRASARVHLTSNPVDWYAARAAGVTAYLLLSGVVLLGLTMAGKKTFARWPRFSVEDIHRFGGLLVGSFVAIHVVTVAIDSWLPFSLSSLVVPVHHEVPADLGRARRRRRGAAARPRGHEPLPAAAALHDMAPGALPQLRGLDRGEPPRHRAAAPTAARRGSWPSSPSPSHRSAPRSPGVPAAAGSAQRVPLAGVAGLARASLIVALGSRPAPLQAEARGTPPASASTLTGHVAQLSGVSRGIVSMAGEGRGRQRVLIRADLLVSTRKLLKTSFQMEYLPSGELCTGSVTEGAPDRLRRRLPPDARRTALRRGSLASERHAPRSRTASSPHTPDQLEPPPRRVSNSIVAFERGGRRLLASLRGPNRRASVGAGDTGVSAIRTKLTSHESRQSQNRCS